ncbi:MAG: Trx7/PDZ domain-containing (seleno)protein [Planctomycetaceae bacterium]
MFIRHSVLLILACAVCTTQLSAEEKKTRDQLVQEDRERVTADGFWIYNDLPAAFAKAKETGKPLLVGFRCIPCEECVKLDDNLVNTDPVIRPLLEKFVCVRVVSTNGLDLSLFQYDTDQSFAMFMLNADRTIYGRFGTRSHRTEWYGDVSLPGLAKALEGALELHANYDQVKTSLAAKTGAPLEFASPEKYPTLGERYTDRLDYSNNVAKTCIHCHQIGDARRDYYRAQNKPIPERLLFPYPHPRSVGLILDPNERATVKSVVPNSFAAEAGFRAGDRIQSLNGQPLLSMADVQWVLDQADPAGATLTASVLRGDAAAPQQMSWTLPSGWRHKDDIDWRASSWGLRRMVTGGMKLDALTAEERADLRIDDRQMALRVQHVGMYGKHAVAKNAGVKKGDVLVSYGSQDDLMTSGAVLAWGIQHTTPGEDLPITLLRNGKPVKLKIRMQE